MEPLFLIHQSDRSLSAAATRLLCCHSTPPLAGTAVTQNMGHLTVVPADDITAACLMMSLAVCGVDAVQQRDDGSDQSGNQPARPPTAGEGDSELNRSLTH